jgi:hypothetical protein
LQDHPPLISPNSVNAKFFTISRTNGGTTDRQRSKKGPEAECALIQRSCKKNGQTWRKVYMKSKTRRDKAYANLISKVDQNMNLNNDVRIDYRRDKDLIDLLKLY